MITDLPSEESWVRLAEADRAMLQYANKLTRAPQTMVASDVAVLREHQFDDRAIHDICCIVGYFAFVNRGRRRIGCRARIASGVPTHRWNSPKLHRVRPPFLKMISHFSDRQPWQESVFGFGYNDWFMHPFDSYRGNFPCLFFAFSFRVIFLA